MNQISRRMAMIEVDQTDLSTGCDVILCFTSFTLKVILATDASVRAFGTVFSWQRQPDDEPWCPIAFSFGKEN
jgi:hypothetical protein